jgi:hypothetical protein
MTKSVTIAAALAALTLATTFTAIGGQAAAHPHFGHNGWGIGAGFAAGVTRPASPRPGGSLFFGAGHCTELGSRYPKLRRQAAVSAIRHCREQHSGLQGPAGR